jgi:hypothetical protein
MSTAWLCAFVGHTGEHLRALMSRSLADVLDFATKLPRPRPALRRIFEPVWAGLRLA